MVDTPGIGRVHCCGDTLFAVDEEPAARFIGIHQTPCKEARVVREEKLKVRFGVERGGQHLDQLVGCHEEHSVRDTHRNSFVTDGSQCGGRGGVV